MGDLCSVKANGRTRYPAQMVECDQTDTIMMLHNFIERHAPHRNYAAYVHTTSDTPPGNSGCPGGSQLLIDCKFLNAS